MRVQYELNQTILLSPEAAMESIGHLHYVQIGLVRV